MSDAMTNREIEDVLTSIRRLVAQEGGRGVEGGRLVLTPAQRVPSSAMATAVALADPTALPDSDLSGPDVSLSEAGFAGPGFDTDPAEDFDTDQYDTDQFDTGLSMPAPDFTRLEATIAELEAAISASGEGFEGEGAGAPPRPSNVTKLYGRMGQGARGAEGPANTPAIPAPPVAPQAAHHPAAGLSAEPVAEAVPDSVADEAGSDVLILPEIAPAAESPPAGAEEDDALDDDALETVIDEATLRELVAQMVREELHGQLGERITQQVRKLVRAEIARAMDERSLL